MVRHWLCCALKWALIKLPKKFLWAPFTLPMGLSFLGKSEVRQRRCWLEVDGEVRKQRRQCRTRAGQNSLAGGAGASADEQGADQLTRHMAHKVLVLHLQHAIEQQDRAHRAVELLPPLAR